jgi:prepilin-type N-terminal cleavage/methylation domain-containing protein
VIRRLAFTLIELLVVIAIIVILLAFAFPGGRLSMIGYLLFGWVGYLGKLSSVRLERSLVLTGALSLAGLLLGLHLFLRWCTAGRQRPADGAPLSPWSLRWTLALAGLAVLAGSAGVAGVGVVRQTAWFRAAPEPTFERGSSRYISSSNLKLLGAACLEHEQKHGTLPAGGTFDAQGRGLHGWQTRLLPYVKYDELYKQVQLEKPWNHPANAASLRTTVYPYTSPHVGGAAYREDGREDGLALSHYAGNVHVLGGSTPRTLARISAARGAENTILAGEVPANFRPWGHPANWRDPAPGLGRSPDGFGNPLGPRQPTQFLFADGSVRAFAHDTDPAVLRSLAHAKAGNQP